MKNNSNDKTIYKFSLKEMIILLIAVAFVSLITGFAVSSRFFSDKSNLNKTEISDSLQTFINNYNYIVENYYGEVDENKLIDSALAGVLSALGDPHTAYIDEDAVNNFNIRLDGTYQGLGVEVYSNSNSQLEVLTVFSDSPAQRAGILSGDIIMKINGEEVNGSDSKLFAEKIKNSETPTFNLSINRAGETIELQINKEVVNIKSVSSKIFEKGDKKIGYLGISIFANNTYSQTEEELLKLENQQIDSLIIDVRGNTGGHLTAVENILGLFLDSSHVIYQTEDSNGIVPVYSSGQETKNYPIIVLTNEISASASEILTAALKEEYGAKSVGKRTYGKGSAQELRTLPDGTQYKFTTKNWLTPHGNSINQVGIDVDLVVEFNSDYYNNPVDDNDNQLQAAIDMIIEQ